MASWLGKLQDRAGLDRPGNNARNRNDRTPPSDEDIEKVKGLLQKDVNDLSRKERKFLERSVREYTGTKVKLRDGLNPREADAISQLAEKMEARVASADVQSDWEFSQQVLDDKTLADKLPGEISRLQNKIAGADAMVKSQYEEELKTKTEQLSDLRERQAGYAERLEGLYQRYLPEIYKDTVTDLDGNITNPTMQPNGQIDQHELDVNLTRLRQNLALAKSRPERFPPVAKPQSAKPEKPAPAQSEEPESEEANSTPKTDATTAEPESDKDKPQSTALTETAASELDVKTYAYGEKPLDDLDVTTVEAPNLNPDPKQTPQTEKQPAELSDEPPSSGLLSRADELDGSRDYLRDLDPIHVNILQQQLRAAGIDPGPIDGKLGEKTMAAVEQYVEKFGVDKNITFDELRDYMKDNVHHVDTLENTSASLNDVGGYDDSYKDIANAYAAAAAQQPPLNHKFADAAAANEHNFNPDIAPSGPVVDTFKLA